MPEYYDVLAFKNIIMFKYRETSRSSGSFPESDSLRNNQASTLTVSSNFEVIGYCFFSFMSSFVNLYEFSFFRWFDAYPSCLNAPFVLFFFSCFALDLSRQTQLTTLKFNDRIIVL